MKERISCFDIDGTLSKRTLFLPLVKSEYESGLLAEASFAKIHELLADYTAGKLAYENTVETLLQTHAEGLRGQNHQQLKAHAEHFLTTHESGLFHSFGRKVIQLLKAEHRVLAVTAEPQHIAESVTELYSLHGHLSSTYREHQGAYTGEVESSLAHRSAKLAALQHYEIEHAFGDSEGDIDILANAKHQYCINPSEALATIAQKRGWQIFDGNDTVAIIQAVKEALKH
ncbi:MAG TPA: haloacid dehalogenase-like hydrolase [Candidatus Saccharimonadales bacterium]